MTMAVAVLACLWAAFPALASGPTGASDPTRSVYIVQFRADPLATTARVTGDRFHPRNPQAVAHRKFLDATQRRVLFGAGVSDAHVGYSYRTTVAGFSARLTAAEAVRIRAQREVASVAADRIRTVPHRRPASVAAGKPMHHAALARAATTTESLGPRAAAEPLVDADLRGQPAEFLGLPEGLWARLGGPEKAGEDVVVGVIDGGIYPEHPSFADEPVTADGTRHYIGPAYGPPPATWRGTCQEGEAWPATTCNNKLIGARYFVDGLSVEKVAEQEFLSPRDVEGHGTSTASIAAGNYGVDPSYLGNDLGVGVISGIAPRARIAHYKAFWAAPAADAGIAAGSDLVAAIDTAVADGIDVLSYAIGGELGATLPISDQSTMLDVEAQALLRAFDAGVVPVLPAGNAGPDADTVEAPGHTPWAISVGASALPVTYAATATVSGGADGPVVTAQGTSPTPALPPTPLIDGASAAAPGATPAAAERCEEGSLDPALVTGKVVLCRPENFLVGSAVLSLAGAAGGILYQPQPRPFRDTWDVWLPSVIVSAGDAAAIRQLIGSTPNATAAFTAGTLTPTTTGDVVTRFSSRGAALGSLSLLKPDLLAPGVDVLAAHTPEVPAAGALFEWSKAERFRPFGGTSASVPLTAGAAALLRSLHPDLDPSELKSALMTTAEPDILIDAVVPSTPATALDKGAGRIDPNRAADAGLVLAETTERFQDYISAQVPTRDPSQPTIAATDLNLASIAFDPLVGPRSTSRTFTSIDGRPGTWTASIEGLTGVTTTVSPAQFSIEPGQSQTVQLAFTPSGARLGDYVDGAVVFTNDSDGRTVRLAVNLRPEEFEAPEQLNFGATEPAGRAPLVLPTGFAGQLSALGYGLARGDVRRDQTVGVDVDDDGEDLNRIAQPGPGVTVFDLTVPTDAKALAAELDDAGLSEPLVDLDLFIFHDDEGDGFRSDDFVDASETASQEALFLLDPDPGAYRISVRGVSADPVATFDLTTWVLDDMTPDVLSDPLVPGLQVIGDPVPVTVGGLGTLQLEWVGLDEPGVYLGFVTFHNAAVPDPNNPLGEMVVAITRP
jgi:hypothetical protein